MKIHYLHSWQVSTAEAKEIQQHLSESVVPHSALRPEEIRTVAAADISFTRYGKTLYAAVVIFSFPGLELLAVRTGRAAVTFPYVPGYLSFREVPVLLKIFEKIPKPDILLCDGQGIAHPRKLGLASHLGVFLDMPTVGCAKSVLVGEYQEPGSGRGDASPLIYQNRTVGLALRTRKKVKPVYVSIGHKISLADAAEVVLRCSPRYRIPEPLRVAHQKVNEVRRDYENSGG